MDGGVGMILLTGATGKVGRDVVRGLLERDAAVQALGRDPEAADPYPRIAVESGLRPDPPLK